MTKTLGVIGSGSMVGHRFCEQTSIPLVKADLHQDLPIDLTDKESVNAFFEGNTFDGFILFSGYTDVDGAEKQRDDKEGICWQINVEGVRNVVEAAKKYNRKLIFISTGFVFDGTNGPYNENAPTGPEMDKVAWYGITKIEGEEIIKRELENFIILRIDYPYLANPKEKEDFLARIWNKYNEGSLYSMWNDQTFYPTFTDDLAPAIELLVSSDQKGTFHLASLEVTTPYEFAKEVIQVFGGDPSEVKAGELGPKLKDHTITPRPLKGGLISDKIVALGFTPTSWKDGIRMVHDESKE